MPRPRAVAPPPAWETALSPLVGTAPEPSADPGSGRAGVGLQFDLVAAAGQAGAESSWRIALRPVVPSRSGWVRSGISWSNLSYARYGQPRRVQQHWQFLKEILALCTAAEDWHYYSGYQQTIYLGACGARMPRGQGTGCCGSRRWRGPVGLAKADGAAAARILSDRRAGRRWLGSVALPYGEPER